MSCSVAVSNSPVFSPSSSLFCNKSSIISNSEALTLSLSHLKPCNSSNSSTTTSSPSASSSPSSPFYLRLSKLPSVFSSSSNTTAQNDAVLKRKRPTRLDIPVSSLGFGVPATPSAVARDVVEAEGDGYSVYCKRGRREYMEDRYTAGVNLRESNLVKHEDSTKYEWESTEYNGEPGEKSNLVASKAAGCDKISTGLKLLELLT